jgi:F0F1-type ATP synthase delta subunit
MVNTVTDTQLLTTCITLLGIFTAMMVNNHRINHLDRRIDDMRDLLRAEMNARFAQVDARFIQVDARFASLEAKMDKYHETVLRLLADMEGRLH